MDTIKRFEKFIIPEKFDGPSPLEELNFNFDAKTIEDLKGHWTASPDESKPVRSRAEMFAGRERSLPIRWFDLVCRCRVKEGD